MTELLAAEKKAIASNNAASDLQRDAAELELMIAQALEHLDSAYLRLRQDEQALEGFLDGYYRQVGRWFDLLEKMRQEIRQADAPAVRREAPEEGTSQEALSREIDQEIKSLYRKLVKLYHPDTVGSQRKLPAEERQILQVINSAYARKDLSDLRRIEFDVFRRQVARIASPEESVRCLSARYDTIIASIDRVSARREMLQASPAWQLKERIETAWREEKDPISPILTRVRCQIEENARQLASRQSESESLKLLQVMEKDAELLAS